MKLTYIGALALALVTFSASSVAAQARTGIGSVWADGRIGDDRRGQDDRANDWDSDDNDSDSDRDSDKDRKYKKAKKDRISDRDSRCDTRRLDQAHDDWHRRNDRSVRNDQWHRSHNAVHARIDAACRGQDRSDRDRRGNNSTAGTIADIILGRR